METIDAVVDELDLPSLLAIRRVNRVLYDIADRSLWRARETLTSFYVANATKLWAIIEDVNGVVGGTAALAFFLRDFSLLPATLDVFVCHREAPPLEWMFDDLESADLRVMASVKDLRPTGQLFDFARQTYSFLSSKGRRVDIHVTYSDTVLLPIASYRTTALINFVGSKTFGCAYPALTLRRQSLLSAVEAPRTGSAQLVLANLKAHGAFSLVSNLHSTGSVTEEKTSAFVLCQRTRFSCSAQGRHFGDAGCLLDRFSPLRWTKNSVATEYRAPCGVSVAWRFSVMVPCDGPCLTKDKLLPPAVHILPAVLPIGTVNFGYEFTGRVEAK